MIIFRPRPRVTGGVSDAVIISYVAAGGYLGRIDFILHEQKGTPIKDPVTRYKHAHSRENFHSFL